MPIGRCRWSNCTICFGEYLVMKIEALLQATLIQAFIFIQVFCLVIFTIASDCIVTGFSSLDIYRHADQDWYILLNPTFLEIFEGIVLLICFYVLRYSFLIRNYPKEFLIKQEILFSLICSVILNLITENTFNNPGFSSSTTNCLLGLMTLPYFLNLLRAALFTSYLASIGKQATFYFPYPFMWIFRDFSKFVFEPYCIRVFEGYLCSREPQSSLD